MAKTKAEETITVTVLDDDIARGKPNDPFSCPIARVLNRTYAGKWSVDCDYATVRYRGRERYYRLPTEASDFVDTFDDTGRAFPIAFSANLYSF